MAEIYSAPKEIKTPNYNSSNYTHENAEKEENRYLDEIRNWLKTNGFKGKNVGEVIRIPTADSSADYMVASLKGGVKLIHLKMGDEWTSQFAELLTAKKINQMIEADKRMAELFPKRG
jgi:hypothetical protein